MLLYIVFSLLTLIALVSLIVVTAENFTKGYCGIGRIFREIRIRLRGTRAMLGIIALTIILLFISDDSMQSLCGTAVAAVTLLILHYYVIFGLFNRKKKAKKLVPANFKELNRLSEVGILPEAPLAPLTPESTKGKSE